MNTKIFNIILFSIILFSTSIVAQQKLNYIQVDKQTYKHFQNKEWEKLIELGIESQKQGITFFYLNYRMGVAYYSKKDYRKAISFFEQVLDKTPTDPVVKEYLYYSYLWGNQVGDAQRILKTLDVKHRKKVQFYNSNKLINNISIDFKNNWYGDYKISDNVIPGVEQKTRNYMCYYNVSFLNYTDGNSILKFNLSKLKIGNTVFNNEYSSNIIDEDVDQYQIGMLWQLNLKKSMNLKLGINYLYESISWFSDMSTATATSWGGGQNNSNNKIISGGYGNFVAYLEFEKSINRFDLSAFAYYSKINNNYITQPFVSFRYYPFGNMKLHTNTELIYQVFLGNLSDKNLIAKQSIGTFITDKINLNAFVMYGSTKSFVDNYGQSIYNNTDIINYWYGASAQYFINLKLSFSLNYRVDNQTNTLFIDNNEMQKKYYTKSIYLSLKYNF